MENGIREKRMKRKRRKRGQLGDGDREPKRSHLGHVYILRGEMEVVELSQELSEELAPQVSSEQCSPGQGVCLWFPYPRRPSGDNGEQSEGTFWGPAPG